LSAARNSWWLPEAAERPEQGDVLDLLPLSRPIFPPKALEKRSIKTGQAWVELPAPPQSGDHHALAKGKHMYALLLSHGCQIDKPNKNVRIQLAPLAPLSNLREDEIESTLAQKNKKRLPLQGVPKLDGDYYADLQTILTFDIALLSACTRIASMTSPGITRLQLQLIAFFTRKDFSAVLDALPELPEGNG
jgi:hypothetical protein